MPFAWNYGHRLSSRVNVAAGNVDLTYNTLGLLQSAITKAAGSTTTNLVQYSYGYDVLNQLSSVIDGRGASSLFHEFSAGGRLKRVSDALNNQTVLGPHHIQRVLARTWSIERLQFSS